MLKNVIKIMYLVPIISLSSCGTDAGSEKSNQSQAASTVAEKKDIPDSSSLASNSSPKPELNLQTLQAAIDKAKMEMSSVKADKSDELAEVRANVDWLWTNSNPPTQPDSWDWPVKFYGYSWWRGYLGARSCGNLAVIHNVIGMKEDALNWLQAGQSHSQGVIDQFARNSKYALEYATQRYTAVAFAEEGVPYYNMGKGALEALDFRAKNFNPPTWAEAHPKPIIERRGGSGKN